MQTQRKLKSRILSLALSAAMVTTMMPATVFAAGGGTAPETGQVGTIQSFDTIEGYTKSVPFDGRTYAITVERGTPFEDLVFPDTLTAMVARTTTAPAGDGDVADSGKVDEAIPDEDAAAGKDEEADDTASGSRPASPSDAEKKEIKDNETPLAPKPEQETVVTTIQSESIAVEWTSDTQYTSETDGRFIYTAQLQGGYIMEEGLKAPQIYVIVGSRMRAVTANVAQIGSTGYETLKDAFDKVNNGDTIEILDDIDLGSTGVTLNKSGVSDKVTLELNGKRITYSGNSNTQAIAVSNCTLEIVDSAGGGELSAAGSQANAILSYSGAAVTITSGTVSATDGKAISSSGTLTVTDGTVSATNGMAIFKNGGTVTISGGAVSATNGTAIYSTSTGAVTVSGGTVNATTGAAISNISTGTVTVSGGTVSATTGTAINNSSTGLITISQDAGNTTLITSGKSSSTGGTISFSVTSSGKLLSVTGGTIQNTASPEGYSVAFSGTALDKLNTVYEKTGGSIGRIDPCPVAEIGSTGYVALESAFNDVKDGETIKLLDDIDLKANKIKLNKSDASVKLDLNGKKITSSAGDCTIKIIAGSLKIVDNSVGGGGELSNTGTGSTITNTSAGTVTVSSGTVSAAGGVAINKETTSTGEVIVTGGTVSATTGSAISSGSTGLITISQDEGSTTLITSGGSGSKSAIFFLKPSTGKLLNVTGGTIQNTASPEGYSVYFAGLASDKLGTVYEKTGGTVGRIYPENAPAPTPPPSGGGNSGGGGGGAGSSRDTTWKSVPQAYQGKTKQIGNVIVPDYTVDGSWSRNAAGNWSFTGKDGVRASNGWTAAFNPYASRGLGQSAFDWFLFDANGNMLTGWYIDAEGNTYYLNPNSDNTLGAMQTGWVLMDGKYYYFNEMPDGTRGRLLKNTTTPDGYYADADGVCAEKK